MLARGRPRVNAATARRAGSAPLPGNGGSVLTALAKYCTQFLFRRLVALRPLGGQHGLGTGCVRLYR